MDADCRRRPVVLLPPPPQAFDAPEPIVDAACGQNYTVATGASGKIYTFGNGGSKCLGHGDTARSPQLREVHQPLHTQPTLQTRICGYSLRLGVVVLAVFLSLYEKQFPIIPASCIALGSSAVPRF